MNKDDIRAKYATIADGVRPETIAADLNVDGKAVRNLLRAKYTRPVELKGTTWYLSNAHANEVVEHFLARRSDANESA